MSFPITQWKSGRRALSYATVFALALVGGLFMSFSLERWRGQDRAIRGVIGPGVVLAGLNSSEIRIALEPRRHAQQNRRFALKLGGQKIETSAERLGLSPDVDGFVRESLLMGRQGSVLAQFGFWLERLFEDKEIHLEMRLEEARLKALLEPWAKQVLPPYLPPTLSYDGQVRLEVGQPGTVLEFASLASRLRDESKRPYQDATIAIEVPTVAAARRVPQDLVQTLAERARRLVAGDIVVRVSVPEAPASQFHLTPKMLGSALRSTTDPKQGTMSLSLDGPTLRAALGALLTGYERPAVDASFSLSPGGVVQLSPSEGGLALDEAALQREIWNAIQTETRSFELPLVPAAPTLTTEAARKLQVQEVVSSFTTMHACCQDRVRNIHHAAALLDKTVLLPGQTFSLNERLGPRTPQAGYHSAPTIVHGEMEEEFGGGISQLATTLFNAALRGGYEIIQRQPHSIYFPRYPEGHEATVSYPLPDLSFRNDSEYGLVIFTRYSGTFIKVLLYGKRDGRRVEVDKGPRTDIVSPPQEFEPDSELLPNKQKRLRAGQQGWTVVVSRTVTYANGTEKREQRKVTYKARPELLRVHPCMIPEGHEGYTGEQCPEPPREEREEELSDETYYDTGTYEGAEQRSENASGSETDEGGSALQR